MLRRSPLITGGLILFALLFTTQAALAGLLKTTPYRYDDGTNAPWQGDRHLVGGPLIGAEIDATVDFAVFAPASAGQGTFQQFLDDNYAGAPADPTAGTEFIYAYQFATVAVAKTTGGGASGIITFTVDLDPEDPLGPTAPIGHDDPVAPSFIPLGFGPGDESPTSNNTTPAFPGEGPLHGSSAKWDFGGLLQVGETSTVLFFSSTRRPEFANGQASVSIVSGQDLFPSPIPEPSTFVLLALGACALLGWRSRGWRGKC
jgi:hypothetical protein